MRIGRMDQRITIERATTTKSESNQDTKTWATYATVWASVTPVRGSETDRTDRVIATQPAEFTVRALGITVLPTDRISWLGTIYDIKSIEATTRKEMVKITANAQT